MYTFSAVIPAHNEEKYMEMFLICFFVLNYCYYINYENDLGGILGAMSPELMVDGKPIDTMFLANWRKICSSYTKENKAIILQIDAFLKYYETHYDFKFPKTRKLLKTNDILNYVDTARKKAQEACLKYNYE